MTGAGNKLFCFGYGYTCDYLGHALTRAGGWKLAGTTRDSEKKALMQKKGVRAYIFDYENPLEDPALFLDGVTHLLISTPPDDRGDPTFLMHGEDIAECRSLRWIGYLSSTSVYGDRGGEWVDETSELRPNTKRGSRRARAEEQWVSLCKSRGLPLHVFRLAGIYGPGRSALDSVRAGTARRIDKPGHAFSRVHVDDIVQTLISSMTRPSPGAVYNVADDRAAPSHEIIRYACELLGLTPPPLIPFAEVDMAPIARSFYADNKRIRNDRIKRDLGITLLYPDFESGLKACLDAERRAALIATYNDPEGSRESGGWG